MASLGDYGSTVATLLLDGANKFPQDDRPHQALERFGVFLRHLRHTVLGSIISHT